MHYAEARLQNQDDFAGGSRGQDVDVGLWGVLDGELFCNDGAERAVGKARSYASETIVEFGFRKSPEREAASGTAARHEIARSDRDVSAIADDDDSAENGEKF